MEGAKEKLQTLGGCLLIPAILVALVMLSGLLLKGSLWLSEILYPILSVVFGITIVVSLLVLLPLAIFKKTRGVAGLGLFIASYIFGATLWVWAFLITYVIWGLVALFIGLFLAGIGVVPIAMLATIVDGQWSLFGQMVVLLLMTFGARMLGAFWMAAADKGKVEHIIDVPSSKE